MLDLDLVRYGSASTCTGTHPLRPLLCARPLLGCGPARLHYSARETEGEHVIHVQIEHYGYIETGCRIE